MSTPFFKKTQKNFAYFAQIDSVAVHNAACPFSASSADLYAVSLQASRTPYAVPSPNNVSASNAFLQYKASVIVCITFICRSCTVLCTESALFCVDTVYFERYNTIIKAPKLFYRNPSCRSRRKPHPPAFVPLCPLCSRKTQ
ncbi:MAG TPA: hypothetical protein DEF33_00195 [Clostridiales bacterium]|nr:hypothetical protein [Clostridiales bacterium]